MPSELERLAAEVRALKGRMDRQASPFTLGTVTAYNKLTGVATIQVEGQTPILIDIPATGPLPIVGATVLLGAAAGDAMVLPKAGHALTAESTNYDGTTVAARDATQGWRLEENGDFEANSGVFRGALVSGALTVVPNETNLIANSGFETNAANWTAGANTTITRSTTQFLAGVASLRLAATGAGTISAVSDAMAVKAGLYYRATTGFYNPVARGQTVAIEWYDDTNTLISSVAVGPISPTAATWHTLFPYVETPGIGSDDERMIPPYATPIGPAPSNAVTAKVRVTIAGCGAGELHYLDSVFFVQTPYISGGWERVNKLVWAGGYIHDLGIAIYAGSAAGTPESERQAKIVWIDDEGRVGPAIDGIIDSVLGGDLLYMHADRLLIGNASGHYYEAIGPWEDISASCTFTNWTKGTGGQAIVHAHRIGMTMELDVYLEAGAAGFAVGGPVSITLPTSGTGCGDFTAVAGRIQSASGIARKISGGAGGIGYWAGGFIDGGGNVLNLRAQGAFFDATHPFTFATTDQAALHMSYQLANA